MQMKDIYTLNSLLSDSPSLNLLEKWIILIGSRGFPYISCILNLRDTKGNSHVCVVS
jgi:hypothetical protein